MALGSSLRPVTVTPLHGPPILNRTQGRASRVDIKMAASPGLRTTWWGFVDPRLRGSVISQFPLCDPVRFASPEWRCLTARARHCTITTAEGKFHPWISCVRLTAAQRERRRRSVPVRGGWHRPPNNQAGNTLREAGLRALDAISPEWSHAWRSR